jgi:crotonobetainyl-CoA:carnitine CoA-transferase CaiB-like acyl-CoA transferase
LRVRIGSLWLGDLEPGDYQQLNAAEIGMLLKNPKSEANAKRFTKETVDERKQAAKEKAAAKPAKKAAKPFIPAAKVRAQKELAKKPKPEKRGRPQATSRSERTPKRPGSKRHR